MKNRINDTRTAARSGLILAAGMAYVLAGSLASISTSNMRTGLASSIRRRIVDRSDRGALSLETAIITAVLSAAAIALCAVIVNAVVSHQNQIR